MIEDHDVIMETLFLTAKQKNLVFNKDKLRYKLTSVPYIGHLLTSEALKADPHKIKTARNMPIPTDVPEVQQYVGFVNYLARHLPKLSKLCKPLRRPTDKNAVRKWAKVHQRAINRIRKPVDENYVLKYFDFNENVTIECNAS